MATSGALRNHGARERRPGASSIDIFDWKIDANNPMNYGLVETGGEGIRGASNADGRPSYATFYAVPSIEDARPHHQTAAPR
jgi:hypothetical protein